MMYRYTGMRKLVKLMVLLMAILCMSSCRTMGTAEGSSAAEPISIVESAVTAESALTDETSADTSLDSSATQSSMESTAVSDNSAQSEAYNDTPAELIITKENPAVVIRASLATSKYDEGIDGTMNASPIKDTDCFHLYDVVVWNDRISLYKFPNNLTENETEGLQDYSLDEYLEWRESYCLTTYEYSGSGRYIDRSKCLREAFIDIFQKAYELTPSENMIYYYSGHGVLGICGMSEQDTKTTLDATVEAFGHKFALIDLSTNCSMCDTITISLYRQYSRYLMASQLDVGGYTMDEWDSDLFIQYNYDEQYSSFFEENQSLPSTCIRGMDLTTDYWKLCHDNLVDSQNRQSITLIDLDQTESFFTMFNQLRREHPDTDRKDVFQSLLQYGTEADQDAYHKLVLYYVDNNQPEFFEWEEKLYGITGNCAVRID